MIGLFYLALLILLIFSTVSANDAEYFEKSIFQALRKRNGQFRSEIEVRKSWLVYDLQENFSFKLNIGERLRNDSNGPLKVLYLSGEKEWHRFGLNPNDKFCISYHWYNFAGIVWELMAYAPRPAFNENSTYNIIGPNVLLEILFENHAKHPERVKCEGGKQNGSKKCSVTFEDTVRLEYNFSDRDGHTMYPERIESFTRNTTTRAWRLVAQFVYSRFSPVFSDEQIISPDLPAGKGCHRSKPENYPRIQTNYGADRFELECELTFDFAQKRKQNRTEPRLRGPRTTRSYPAKLYVDRSSVSVAETVDETTNASIRTFYEADTRRLDAVALADGQCRTYDLTADRSLNWFYVQEMFVRKPELFSAVNYSYLRRTDDGDVPCLVFEKQHAYLDDRVDERTRNLTITNRRNHNGVPTTSIYVISSHYYEVGRKPDRSGQLLVPRKIELTILDSRSLRRFNSLTINVSAFNGQPKEPHKYDRSKCSAMDEKASSQSIELDRN